MFSPRAAYAASGVLYGGGVAALAWLGWAWPWPGSALIAAGLMTQWLAGQARQEALWRDQGRAR